VSGARGYLIVAAVISAVVLFLNSFLRPDYSQRNSEIFTEMVYSRAYESFSPSPFLPGGVTQQPVAEGVVVRGQSPLYFGPGTEEAQRAGRELLNPIAGDDSAALANGAELYITYCVICHDAGGNGKGTVVMRGMLPPPSLHAVRAKDMADGEMFHILTHGQANMASYAAQLSPTERWQVVRYVRKLQEEN